MSSSELSSSLRSVISALHKGLRKQVYSVQSYSMTEMETIGHLCRNESFLPTELAALARVKAQSMSQILSKLEKQGLIKKTPSAHDGRKIAISLTAAGKRMVEQTRYERDEWLRHQIEATLTAREQELLLRAMPVLNKLASIKQPDNS